MYKVYEDGQLFMLRIFLIIVPPGRKCLIFFQVSEENSSLVWIIFWLSVVTYHNPVSCLQKPRLRFWEALSLRRGLETLPNRPRHNFYRWCILIAI